MTDTDGEKDAEELLEQSKEQSRHTSEPDVNSTPAESEDVSRVEAIKQALVEIEENGAPENINCRDPRLKALLVGLDEADELGSVATDIVAELDDDRNVETDNVSQSDVARLLMRAGLQAALPSLLEDAEAARKRKAVEQAENDTF